MQVALQSATALEDKDCWHKLGVEALRQGNHQIVEMAYQKTKDFERLSFLYLLTGNTEKLTKMLRIAEMRGDVMGPPPSSPSYSSFASSSSSSSSSISFTLSFCLASGRGPSLSLCISTLPRKWTADTAQTLTLALRVALAGRFHNALYLGDAQERIKVLREQHQPALAYMAAQAHGLTELAAEIEPMVPEEHRELCKVPHPSLCSPDPASLRRVGFWRVRESRPGNVLRVVA